MACSLAREIAVPLTQNASLLEIANQGLRDAMREARGLDAQEGTPKVLDDVWLKARE